MTVAVRLRPEAEQDLADAAAWYEEQLPGLGNKFLDEVLSTFSAIAEAPLRYPILHHDTRRALIHRFPFGIYFRAESTAIVVLAVMHGSRNPRRWKTRV
jgi:plasmid stabilization system protein ParE